MNASVVPISGDDVAWMAARIATLHAQSSHIKYELLTFIREFDIAGGWRRDGATSCAAWLQDRLGMADPSGRL